MVGAFMHHGIGSAFVDSLEILGPLSPTSSGLHADDESSIAGIIGLEYAWETVAPCQGLEQFAL